MNYMLFPTGNGIVGYHKKKKVFCYIDENGKKRVKREIKRKKLFLNIPFLRGLFLFVFGIIALLNITGDNISVEIEKSRSKTKKAFEILLTILLAFGFSIFLFGFVPAKLSFVFIGFEKSVLLRNFLIAIIKVGIIYLFMGGMKILPQMQEVYRFNGAINLALKEKVEEKKQRFWDYATPLNFLNFSFFTFILSVFVITLVGIQISVGFNLLINLGFFVLITMVSYEILVLLSKNKKLEKLSILSVFFVVLKPSLTHDEVGRMVLIELNSKEKYFGEKVKEKKEIAMSQVLTEMQTKLSKAGKYEKSDVEWIIATVLKKNRAEAKLVRSVDEKAYREIMKNTDERAQGKPLSLIFGFVDFYGLRFSVNRKVLAPRMETEILVEKVIKNVKSKKDEILDIGTGSGAIAISVEKNTNARVCAVDVSKGALEVAKENAKNNKSSVEFLESDLFKGLKRNRKFDIIVSNPPYIRTLDIEGLDEEVKNYDPKLALDGGEDGLNFYRAIITQAKAHLKSKGKIFFEIGKGQYAQVKKILKDNGFENIKGTKDYNRIYRVIEAENGND